MPNNWINCKEFSLKYSISARAIQKKVKKLADKNFPP